MDISGFFATIFRFIGDIFSSLFTTFWKFIVSIISAGMIYVAKLFLQLFEIKTDAYFGGEGIVAKLVSTYTPSFRAIGLSVLILIATWHIFKGFFSFLGLGTEPEEAWKIGLKCIMFGILLIYSGYICRLGLSVFDKFVEISGFSPDGFSINVIDIFRGEFSGMFNADNTWSTDESFKHMLNGIVGGFTYIFIFDMIQLMLLCIFCLQIIGVAIDLAGKYLKIGILIIIAPVSFACGVTKATNQIFSAWVKTYIGALVSVFIKYFFMGVFIKILPEAMGGATFKEQVKSLILFICFMSLLKQSDSLVNELGFAAGMTPTASGMLGQTAKFAATKASAGFRAARGRK